MRQTRWLPPSESAFYLVKVGIKPYAGLLAIATERIEQGFTTLSCIIDSVHDNITDRLPYFLNHSRIGLVAYSIIVKVNDILELFGKCGFSCTTAPTNKPNRRTQRHPPSNKNRKQKITQ